MNSFNDVMLRRQWQEPDFFPELRRNPSFLIFSDYGGDHKGCPFNGYAFLYVGSDSFPAWDERRLQVRERFRIRNRTFAYKKLTDQRKLRALPSFLEATRALHGLCVVLLIDKRIESLFAVDHADSRKGEKELWPEARFSSHTFERLRRIVYFNSFFTAGLVGKSQNVVWITDQDEIASNRIQLTALTDALGRCLGAFLLKDDGQLAFTLGHCRCGTTASDVNFQCEDLAAIPDLTIGAVLETMACYTREDSRPTSHLMVPPPKSIPGKVQDILNWFSDDTMRVRRLALLLEPGRESRFQIKVLNFHGSNQLGRLASRPIW